jgi:K+-sensing histidine kinase KdpD
VNINRSSRFALVGGPLLALALGAATSSIRDQVGASNVGIALACIVAGAALVSRGAALSTAVAAALTFNFFHTRPYHSLRVHSSRDVAIVALLGGLGLIISDLSAWRRRRDALAHHHVLASAAPDSVAELVAQVHPVAVVWPAVIASILDELGVADCGLVAEPPANLPVISRSRGRSMSGDDSFVLPSKGASIEVQNAGTSLGYLVVIPPPGATSLTVERRVIVALADHIALALTYGARVPSARAS